ncbi:calcium-binding protein, partial [Limnohabitans sp. JirII-31]|uniref:calcium-binding protein n=1 Tax=Limnohabitans sp. JirII-31 TaxID=1977908 RepID=UPI0026F4707A
MLTDGELNAAIEAKAAFVNKIIYDKARLIANQPLPIDDPYSGDPFTGLPWPDQNYDDILNDIGDKFKNAETTKSPLVLDLDGDGVETTLSSKTGVHFDLDKSGFAEQAGWVGKDDGLLVRDLNGDGKITHGGELFGNHTVLKSGSQAANGFEALKDLDDNNDGKVDANDSAYASLRVWKDLNSDGVTEDGELITLEQAGVQSLNVRYTDQGTSATKDAQGNQHQQLGSYTKADGSTQQMDDVWFSVDTARTVNLNTVAVSDEIAALPELRGMGNVASLRQAMAQDSSGELQTLVEQWVGASEADRPALLTDLIYHWAGVQDVDPNSRAASKIYGNVIGDARKLATLEAFLGESYLGTWCWGERDPNPHGQAAPILLAAFDELQSYFKNQLLIETDLNPLMGSLGLKWVDATSSFDVDVEQTVDLLRASYDTSPATAATTIYNFASVLDTEGDFGAKVLLALNVAAANEVEGFAQLLSYADKVHMLGTSGDDVLRLSALNSAAFLQGYAGNDALYGGTHDDVMEGGAGNDRLEGAAGNDTYVFNQGDGADTIYDYDYTAGNVDTLQLGAGLLAGDTQISLVGDDLKLSWGTDSVTLHNYFSSTYNLVEKISFADGTTWGITDIASKMMRNGSEGADFLVGLSDYANRINGLGGNDALYGGNQDDVLDGGEGDDTLGGGSGNDTLIGGAGNDTLDGGYGNDTYVFNQGDGQDTINDLDYWWWQDTDTLQLGAGLLVGDTQV